jgi:glyoxylase-like metal-dependent hydrolase (beta-lactamase superfamily II)
MDWHWTVGTMDVFRLDAANFGLPTDAAMPAWAVPRFTPSTSETPLAFSALVVRTPEATIVVDPWIVDDSPRSRPDASSVVDERLGDLAAIGIDAAAVDVVVNSHIDGIGWNTRPVHGGWQPTFGGARYLFPADEMAAVDRGEPINGSEHVGPIVAAGVLERIDPPYEVVPGVTLVDAPGHNFGHVAVRIEDGDDLAIYAGHLVLSLLQIDDPAYDVGDPEAFRATATATRRALLGELADRRGTLLTTLIGGPGCGTVERHGDGFRLVASHGSAANAGKIA